MTTPAQNPFFQVASNAATTTYAMPFALVAGDSVLAWSNGLSIAVASVTGNGSAGSVTLAAAQPTGAVLSFARRSALQRLRDYSEAGVFRADTLDADFDDLWRAVQELYQRADNAVVGPLGSAGARLPVAVNGLVLGWVNGQLANVQPDGSGSAVTISPFMLSVLDDADAQTVRTSIGAVDAGTVQTLAGGAQAAANASAASALTSQNAATASSGFASSSDSFRQQAASSATSAAASAQTAAQNSAGVQANLNTEINRAQNAEAGLANSINAKAPSASPQFTGGIVPESGSKPLRKIILQQGGLPPTSANDGDLCLIY